MVRKRIGVTGALGIGSVGDEVGLSLLHDAVCDFADLTVFMRRPTERYAFEHGVRVTWKLEHETREAARSVGAVSMPLDASAADVAAALATAAAMPASPHTRPGIASLYRAAVQEALGG